MELPKSLKDERRLACAPFPLYVSILSLSYTFSYRFDQQRPGTKVFPANYLAKSERIHIFFSIFTLFGESLKSVSPFSEMSREYQMAANPKKSSLTRPMWLPENP